MSLFPHRLRSRKSRRQRSLAAKHFAIFDVKWQQCSPSNHRALESCCVHLDVPLPCVNRANNAPEAPKAENTLSQPSAFEKAKTEMLRSKKQACFKITKFIKSRIHWIIDYMLKEFRSKTKEYMVILYILKPVSYKSTFRDWFYLSVIAPLKIENAQRNQYRWLYDCNLYIS